MKNIGVILVFTGFLTMLFGVYQLVLMIIKYNQFEWKILAIGILILLLGDELKKRKNKLQININHN
jgi:hypothetical protein